MSESKKKKILLISDDIRLPSGVGGIALRLVTHLKNKYDFVHIGAAVQHTEKTASMWNGIKILPSSGFGNPFFLRQVIDMEKPDLIWLFTDPRFFTWLWNMEDEIRDKIPIYYYHVWDNYPIPKYNESWYKSCDFISCISSQTHNIVKSFGVPCNLALHGIDPNEYSVLPYNVREDNRKKFLGKKYDEDAFIAVWASRNIRRKNPSNIIQAFYNFQKSDKAYEKSYLIMHTDPIDHDGTDLYRVHRDCFPEASVIFSSKKMPPSYLNALFNAADCTISYSSAEGFGLTPCESMMCGTPIIVGLTGGLKDQIVGYDGKLTGIGIEPAAKTIAGSPPTPYIYEDHFNVDDFTDALKYMHNLAINKKEQYRSLREYCRINAEKKFNIFNMVSAIDEGITYCLNNFKPRLKWTMDKYNENI